MTVATLSHLTTLADPTRARLLMALEGRELSVGELAVALQLPQSTVSRHLKVLADDGWVATRPDGTARYYRMATDLGDRPGALWAVVREEMQGAEGVAEDRERVEAIIAERRTRSREFFSTVSGHWGEVRRELFGARSDLSVLASLADPDWAVGDLGCGDGRLTELLAPHVKHVVAVDASSEMLEAARDRLSGLVNVDLRLSDLERVPVETGTLDVAMLSLVLHYLSQPALVIAEAVRTLKPGGRLVVMDMVPHDREELRRSMGHAWSGFAASQLNEWMQDAGLAQVRICTLPRDPDAKGPGLFVATGRAGNRVVG